MSAKDQPRQPGGQSIGGQFDKPRHGEPTIELGAAPTGSTAPSVAYRHKASDAPEPLFGSRAENRPQTSPHRMDSRPDTEWPHTTEGKVQLISGPAGQALTVREFSEITGQNLIGCSQEVVDEAAKETGHSVASERLLSDPDESPEEFRGSPRSYMDEGAAKLPERMRRDVRLGPSEFCHNYKTLEATTSISLGLEWDDPMLIGRNGESLDPQAISGALDAEYGVVFDQDTGDYQKFMMHASIDDTPTRSRAGEVIGAQYDRLMADIKSGRYHDVVEGASR